MVRQSITCISLLFIGCGISYYCFDKYNSIKEINNNELLTYNYLYNKNSKSNKKQYISILEIPSINFKRGLYKKKSPESELSKNIIFLDESDMPDKKNSKVIIVGHSGAPSNAYFKNLYRLKLKDDIILYYKNKQYDYIVTDIYEIKKNGTLALESNKSNKTLTLVTCKGMDRQLVIVSTLKKEKFI